MQLNRRTIAVFAGLVAVTFNGCGGGTKPVGAKPGAGAAAVGPAPVAGANPAPANLNGPPGQAPQQVANGTTSSAAPVEEIPPPGPDDFQIDPTERVTEIVGEHHEPTPDPVDVSPLPSGLNSDTLIIYDPNAEPAGVNVPPRQTPPLIRSAADAASNESTDEDSTTWKLPEGATEVPGAGIDPETGLPLRITTDKDRIEMVLIPPGVFLEGVDGRDTNAAPQHSVLLESPYYIDVVEVTVARHDAFREAIRKAEGGRKLDPPVNHDGNRQSPAVGIKFLDAKFYAKWAGKELPTEAQWERAARGPTGFDYPWGNGRPIFHHPRRPGQLDPVSMYPGDLSPFGVYDMAGNAREWCLDLYSPDSFEKDVSQKGNPVRNPTGPRSFQGVKQQVVKGGKTDWAVWHRQGLPQNEIAPDIGFRCVLNITTAKDAAKNEKRAGTKPAEKSPATKNEKAKKKNVGL